MNIPTPPMEIPKDVEIYLRRTSVEKILNQVLITKNQLIGLHRQISDMIAHPSFSSDFSTEEQEFIKSKLV